MNRENRVEAGETMYAKPLILGVLLTLLCLIDAAATQYEVTHHLTSEGNPLGARIIGVGWVWVWTIKIAAPTALLTSISALLARPWGKVLIFLVTACYTGIAFAHLTVFMVCSK
jgi:hypothetical protein